MENLELAQEELLRESSKSGIPICKIACGENEYVKVRRGYAYPEETRKLYLSALDELVKSGRLCTLMKNQTLELYEVVGMYQRVSTLCQAKQVLIDEALKNTIIYKVHGNEGEFVQCGSSTFSEVEEERILFLEALCDLVYRGSLQVLSDSKELSRYQLMKPHESYGALSQGQSTMAS